MKKFYYIKEPRSAIEFQLDQMVLNRSDIKYTVLYLFKTDTIVVCVDKPKKRKKLRVLSSLSFEEI